MRPRLRSSPLPPRRWDLATIFLAPGNTCFQGSRPNLGPPGRSGSLKTARGSFLLNLQQNATRLRSTCFERAYMRQSRETNTRIRRTKDRVPSTSGNWVAGFPPQTKNSYKRRKTFAATKWYLAKVQITSTTARKNASIRRKKVGRKHGECPPRFGRKAKHVGCRFRHDIMRWRDHDTRMVVCMYMQECCAPKSYAMPLPPVKSQHRSGRKHTSIVLDSSLVCREARNRPTIPSSFLWDKDPTPSFQCLMACAQPDRFRREADDGLSTQSQKETKSFRGQKEI